MNSRLKIEYVPLGRLTPFMGNPRRISPENLARLGKSLEDFGIVDPVIAQRGTGMVIGGHQRLEAAKALGLAEVPVVWLDIDNGRARALNIALNNPNLQGEWDDEKLGALLSELKRAELDELTGFGDDEVGELLRLLKLRATEDTTADPGRLLEEAEEDCFVEAGQVWRCGRHRVICGDSKSPECADMLLDGQRADLVVTSPPYGVGKEYEERGVEPWFALVGPAVETICARADVVAWNISDLYSTGGQYIEPLFAYSVQLFGECGYKPLWIRIWDKPGMRIANTGAYYLVTHKPAESYEYVAAFTQGRYKFVNRLTREERKAWGFAGVWHMNRAGGEEGHRAAFPEELPNRIIKMHTDKDGRVWDPFLGSGTTLMAAEKLGRVCYGMDIQPVYVQVALRRWEALTGEKAELCS